MKACKLQEALNVGDLFQVYSSGPNGVRQRSRLKVVMLFSFASGRLYLFQLGFQQALMKYDIKGFL